MRKYATFLLKACLAIAILVWLARSGKLDFSRMAVALAHWPMLVVIVAVIYLQIVITAWRWELLLRAQGFMIGISLAVRLNLIGSLFNMVIPGAVGGDVMKAYYVTRDATGRKAEAVATILLDRVVGLMGLLMLAGAVALWNLRSIGENPPLMALCIATIAAACGSIVALFVAVRFGWRFSPRNPSGRVARVWCRFLAALDGYRQNRTILPATILVSMLCHAAACSTIYVAMLAIGAPAIPLRYFLLAAPLGLVATALPLAPAGIGVGQVAFLSLFQIVAPASASNAVNALTVYQTLVLLVCTTGFIPYLTHKRVELAQLAPAASQDGRTDRVGASPD
jgi:glycosyltransferase 2 family protein